MNATDDWFEVIQLAEGSYKLDEAKDYSSFLIEGADRAVVIDAGTGVGDLHGLATDMVDRPITLALTHTHWDHIGSASQFDDVLVSSEELPADGRVAIDSMTDEFDHRPTQFTNRWVDDGSELPDGLDPDEHTVDPFDASAIPADEGIDLGDRILEVILFPGHSPGHLGLLDPATDVLYGADIVHMDKNLYVMFDDCDLEAYVDSMERLRDLRDKGAFEVLATSHNDHISGEDLSLIDDLLDGLREIVAGKREYERVETDWGEARSYEIGPSTVMTKTDI